MSEGGSVMSSAGTQESADALLGPVWKIDPALPLLSCTSCSSVSLLSVASCLLSVQVQCSDSEMFRVKGFQDLWPPDSVQLIRAAQAQKGQPLWAQRLSDGKSRAKGTPDGSSPCRTGRLQARKLCWLRNRLQEARMANLETRKQFPVADTTCQAPVPAQILVNRQKQGNGTRRDTVPPLPSLP
jgi:hypothetical protein